MSKWSHLVESGERIRELERQLKSNPTPEIAKATLVHLLRTEGIGPQPNPLYLVAIEATSTDSTSGMWEWMLDRVGHEVYNVLPKRSAHDGEPTNWDGEADDGLFLNCGPHIAFDYSIDSTEDQAYYPAELDPYGLDTHPPGETARLGNLENTNRGLDAAIKRVFGNASNASVQVGGVSQWPEEEEPEWGEHGMNLHDIDVSVQAHIEITPELLKEFLGSR